ncbi:MAG: methyltransferase domain-containing protein, partial [bacterium]|nr:methyltransferase domain-containing protein [bacterium]
MTTKPEFTVAIDKRYSELAESTCCLSCGGAKSYSQPQPGEVCLDLGSGRGNDVLKMALEVGEEGFAYGIDISDGMIKKAQKNAKKMDIKNAEFIQSELHDLKLPDETVDLVISNCTINHAPDKDAVWRDVYRVLKDGGRFVVSDIFSSAEVPEEYANDPSAIAECWAGAVTREEYLATLEKTGFEEIKILEECAPYAKGKIEVSSFTIMGW